MIEEACYSDGHIEGLLFGKELTIYEADCSGDTIITKFFTQNMSQHNPNFIPQTDSDENRMKTAVSIGINKFISCRGRCYLKAEDLMKEIEEAMISRSEIIGNPELSILSCHN